jgi:hypothetical protein
VHKKSRKFRGVRALWHVALQKRFESVAVERTEIEVSIALPTQALFVAHFVVLHFWQRNTWRPLLAPSITVFIATVCADSHFVQLLYQKVFFLHLVCLDMTLNPHAAQRRVDSKRKKEGANVIKRITHIALCQTF